jgi:hypothetical protein
VQVLELDDDPECYHTILFRSDENMKEFFVAFLCLSQFIFSSAYYAVGFHAGTQQSVRLLNSGSTFTDPPTVEQVADLFSRLSGLAPLLWEGDDFFLKHHEKDLMLHIF